MGVVIDSRPRMPSLFGTSTARRPSSSSEPLISSPPSASPLLENSEDSQNTLTSSPPSPPASSPWSPGYYTSGQLKRDLSGKFDTISSVFTLPTAHFLLIASKKDSVHEYVFRDGQAFVDRVYAKEIVNELTAITDVA